MNYITQLLNIFLNSSNKLRIIFFVTFLLVMKFNTSIVVNPTKAGERARFMGQQINEHELNKRMWKCRNKYEKGFIPSISCQNKFIS